MTLAWLPLVLALGPRPELVVVADDCLEVDEAELLGTIDLELGAGIDYRGGAAQAADTELLLDCGAEGRAELTIIDPLTQTHATRVIEMPAPERRTEELGWAAAAFVRATWTALEADAREDRRQPEVRRAIRAARRPTAPWQIGDGFVVRRFFDPASPRLMLGEQVEVLHRPTRSFAWKADGELNYIRERIDESEGGPDRVRILAIHAAPAILAWHEFPSSRPLGRGAVALYGGAGLRIGGVRMRSDAVDDGSFELFAGPFATARASVRLGRFVRLSTQLEAGWILHGPREPGGVPRSFVGPWLNGVLILVSSF